MKKMRLIFLSIVALLASYSLYAQQDAQLTQYMYNGLFYNPALAGAEGGTAFSVLHRSQWLGYSNNTSTAATGPTTQVFNVSHALTGIKSGVGLSFVNDNLGAASSIDFKLSFAHHIDLSKGRLSVGVQAGFYSAALNFAEFQVVRPDPLVPATGRETQMNPDFGVGVWFDTDNYFVGLSSRHLVRQDFDFGTEGITNPLENHAYLSAGYKINSFYNLEIVPSFLLKTVALNNFSYDVSVIATHKNKISGGVAYRSVESASLLIGYSLLKDNSLKLGYAFDLVIAGQAAKEPTSHELMLTYRIPSKSASLGGRSVVRTPRFRF